MAQAGQQPHCHFHHCIINLNFSFLLHPLISCFRSIFHDSKIYELGVKINQIGHQWLSPIRTKKTERLLFVQSKLWDTISFLFLSLIHFDSLSTLSSGFLCLGRWELGKTGPPSKRFHHIFLIFLLRFLETSDLRLPNFIATFSIFFLVPNSSFWYFAVVLSWTKLCLLEAVHFSWDFWYIYANSIWGVFTFLENCSACWVSVHGIIKMIENSLCCI